MRNQENGMELARSIPGGMAGAWVVLGIVAIMIAAMAWKQYGRKGR